MKFILDKGPSGRIRVLAPTEFDHLCRLNLDQGLVLV
jgi:hypothetical protein